MTSFSRIAAADGTELATYVWTPAGEPKAIVQIAHGMAEHAARYERFAGALTAAGYVVYANDHRGHGATGPRRMADLRGWRSGARSDREHAVLDGTDQDYLFRQRSSVPPVPS